MSAITDVIRYQLSNVIRGRWVVAYALFFLASGEAMLRFGGDASKALLSLVNLVLFVVPLVSLVFGTAYAYGSREFNELLLTQPVRRGHLFTGLFAGLVVPLAGAVAAGIGLPFLLRGGSEGAAVVWVAACGALLTCVFVALAFWIALRIDDRARGLGLALLVWLGLGILYDAGVLALVAAFGAWPLERAMLAVTLTNPIDLARVLMLLRLDVAALMGYTGAVFERAFGTPIGLAVGITALAAWCALPLWRAARTFQHKDF